MKKDDKTAGFRGSRFLLNIRAARRMCRSLFCTGLLAFGISVCALLPCHKVYAAPIKIVIDPGHGGDEMGAQSGMYTEKYMTMVVAKAMAEELQKYEGVEVYLTRTEDVKMSVQERADFANEKGADFLFCLHFNASKKHDLYGAEVWCSLYDNCYTEGRRFGEMCLDELCSEGIYRRGVKMRQSEKVEDADYYGIIRHCTEYNIPSCIIEHCHIDNKEDIAYFNTTEGMKKLGVLDATAVAKYYGLSSKTLGVSYKGYPRPDVEGMVKPDSTEPKNVGLTCIRVKKETGEAELLLTGEDKESGLLYYSYSLNGGETYSSLQKWDENLEELDFVLSIPKDQDVDLICRVYNGYDLYTETETVHIDALEEPPESVSSGNALSDGEETGLEGDQESAEAMSEISEEESEANRIDMSWYERKDADKKKDRQFTQGDLSTFFWLLILAFLISLLVVLIPARAIAKQKRKRARYRNRRR